MKFFQFHDLDREFVMLTQINLDYIFILFLIDFFSISFFNNGLIGN
jgi:hypothetical protein